MTATNPYADVHLFLRVVELGSIRAAAREKGLEASSVSRRLTHLERRLKTKLIDRTQARSSATDPGMRYYERMRDVMSQIEAIESDVSGDAAVPRGLLKVNASIDFGQRHVARWLLDFRKRYPEVDVQLTLASHFVDIVSEGIDVAIRVGQLKDSALKARKIANVPRVLVASPDYLERFGVPEDPQELEDHQHVFFVAANRNQPLLLTGPNGRKYAISRRGGVTINAVNSVVEAVKAGFGIHGGPRWAFHQALEKGEVVELLPSYIQPTPPMHVIWRHSVLLPARVRAFIDFAAEEAGKVEGLAQT